MLETEQQIAVVTGASAGLGAEFAHQLARDGYFVWLVARRVDRLEKLAADICAAGGDAMAVECDLADSAALASLCEEIANEPRISLLVNNAGFGEKSEFAAADDARVQTMIDVHVSATAQLTRAALGGMVPRRRGGVLNVASVAGFFQSPSDVMYCSTKAWMISFTEGLSLELHGSGVAATVLCPGFTLTEFHDVLGVSRSTVPQKHWLTAEFVVAAGLKAIRRGRWMCVPHWRYRLYAGIGRWFPKWLLHPLARRRRQRNDAIRANEK